MADSDITTCSAPSCKRASVVRGWCKAHYYRWSRYGDPLGGSPLKTSDEDRPCDIAGCDKPKHGKGLCRKHHERLRKYGDPHKLTRTSPGEPWQWLMGHVNHSGEECLIWPYGRRHYGYGAVDVPGSSKRHYAHREMCRLAHGEPPHESYQAAHNCGNGHLACVNPRHLRWDTQQGNLADRHVHGTINRGARNGSAKLTEDDVREIRSLAKHLYQREVAEMFGLSRQTVSDILRRRRWAWLD